MTLRTRILLGYGYLVSLLVVSAAGAALAFHQLGTNIGRVLDENFFSVRSSMRMLEALERQDSAVLALLLGEETSRDALDRSYQNFLGALGDARGNITIDAEREIIDEIEVLGERYRQARETLLSSRHERPLLAYEADAFPRFEQVKTRVFDLLEVNHRAMVEADQNAQRAATRRAVMLGLLVVVALLSLAYLSQALQRELLARLDELKAVAEAMADGDLGRRAPVARADELGLLARQVNSVLDRQRQLEGSIRAQLAVHRQLLLALLATYEGGAAMVAADGTVIATTLDAAATDAVAAAVTRLPPLEQVDNPDSRVRVDEPAGLILFRPLLVGGVRPVGWLASVV